MGQDRYGPVAAPTPAALRAIAFGDGNNDNQFEVYASCLDHHLYEFKLNGSTWAATDMGSVPWHCVWFACGRSYA